MNRRRTKIYIFLNYKFYISKKDFYRLTTGYFDIPASILSATAHELSLTITSLFDLFLDSGLIPCDWKIALIRPNYKVKKRQAGSWQPKIYLYSILSPISLLPFLFEFFKFRSLSVFVSFSFHIRSISVPVPFSFCSILNTSLVPISYFVF